MQLLYIAYSFSVTFSVFSDRFKGFPGGSDSKESASNARDPGSIPGSGRSPGGGHGNPLQYSCLENPVDRGAWRATVLGVTKSQTRLSNSHTHTHTIELTLIHPACEHWPFFVIKIAILILWHKWELASWGHNIKGIHKSVIREGVFPVNSLASNIVYKLIAGELMISAFL